MTFCNFSKPLLDCSPRRAAVRISPEDIARSLLIFLELKRTPVVVSQFLWQPFNVRFKNFLDRLDFHRKVLHTELEVLHFKSHSSWHEAEKHERIADEVFQTEARKHFELVEASSKRWDEEARST